MNGQQRIAGGAGEDWVDMTSAFGGYRDGEIDVDRRARNAFDRGAVAGLTGLALAALGWAGFVGWAIATHGSLADAAPVLGPIALILLPLIGLLAIVAVIARRPESPAARLSAMATETGRAAGAALRRLADAEARLASATATLDESARNAAALSEARTEALLALVSRIEAGAASLRETACETLPLLGAIEEAAPQADARLTTLIQSLASYSEGISTESAKIEDGLRSATLVAEDVELRLTAANAALHEQMNRIAADAVAAGDALSGATDIAVARADLAVEQVRAAMTENAGHFDQLHDQGARTMAQLGGMPAMISDLAGQLVQIETDAAARQEAMLARLGQGVQSAQGIGTALQDGNTTAENLTRRIDALLLALDSALREIDESLPAALGRADARLDQSADVVARLAGSVDTATARLAWAGDNLTAHSAALDESVAAADAALGRHGEQIGALHNELATMNGLIGKMGEEGVPTLVATLEALRDAARAATIEARNDIETLVSQASAQLGEAGGAALEDVVRDKINAQIGQVADIADNAVKAAHRATDHLMRQMMALNDSAADLEGRISRASDEGAARDRDFLTEHSTSIIAALSDNALDIAKLLGHDVGQREWSAYLAGDKSLFARRAVRLLSSGELRQVHALYDTNADFREHVNRYVEAFEAMLRDVLAGRNGNSLAITLVSSDIGKLYVALAQAIERLRVAG